MKNFLRYIPNAITIIRLILVLPIAYLLWKENFFMAFVLFIVAGLSDGLDGFFARQFHWESRFGAIADPIADKALLITTYLLLSYHGHIPVWLTLLLIIRDLTIVAGATAYHNFYGPYKFNPTLLGKISTACQISLAFCVLFSISIQLLPIPFLWTLIGLVTLASIASGTDYVLTWSKKARLAHQQKIHQDTHEK